MQPNFPTYLNSYADLREHFDIHFEGLNPRDRGARFVHMVQGISLYTNFGSRGFKEPVLQKESHDGGVDLIAEHSTTKDILCIQSKYTIPDKDSIDNIISKFEGFTKNHYRTSGGPLFAQAGVSVDGEPEIFFQIVSASSLDNIIKKYESSQYSSIQFYKQLCETKRLEIIDGPRLLEILRTAYRKANVLPSDFEITFVSDIIVNENVYVGILSSKELRRLYAQYGDALFYENVRNFLSPRNREVSDSGTSINEEIIKTVKHNPEQFLARNNGIVIKAQEALKVDNRTLRLRESSVVNGCQTTMCIVGYTNLDNEVMVMAKVVGTDQAWDVARAANLQNDVTRFELEIAQFLRPQLVNKAASHEGYRVVGNDSAFSLLDSIYSYEIMYEDLRSLFVGIFSASPNNIFGTSYLDLLPELIGQFYANDPDGTQLLNKLFQIQQAASKSMQRLQEKMQEKGITISAYQRFFKDNKAAYRAFFTLLAAASVSEIDLSQRISDVNARYKTVSAFLDKTLSIIQNEPSKFERHYRFALQATASIIPSEKDKESVNQLLWQVIRRANFGQLLERMKLTALDYEL